ncbi:DNA dC-_dU-editing enzyme APOBEC-3B-like [Cynocephalus volans]|uniref:DNA dC->dU-editing enzyme APOBEC-3B-like n=1 Tax=Cynocephalus volans TaxID=110931 RepID=UPI002FC995AF
MSAVCSDPLMRPPAPVPESLSNARKTLWDTGQQPLSPGLVWGQMLTACPGSVKASWGSPDTDSLSLHVSQTQHRSRPWLLLLPTGTHLKMTWREGAFLPDAALDAKSHPWIDMDEPMPSVSLLSSPATRRNGEPVISPLLFSSAVCPDQPPSHLRAWVHSKYKRLTQIHTSHDPRVSNLRSSKGQQLHVTLGTDLGWQGPYEREMEPWRQGQRFPGARSRQAYRGGCSWCPQIRNPMEGLYRGTFYFHFRNLRYASGRNTAFLCYRVEAVEHRSPVLIDRGVFKNQVYPCPPLHAELCFLSWFFNNVLSRDKHYLVTWYISWSPCCECAEQVADFLARHRNVRLTIFAARLYYFWKSEYRQGLRRLCWEGAQVDVMSFQEFQSCWEEFVYNQGMPFKPWKKLTTNFHFLNSMLGDILRNTMRWLKEDVFSKQFNNQHRVKKPYFRRKTYLCYQLKLLSGPTLDKGCFQNEKRRHAEIRFIDKIQSMRLDPAQSYEITCYLTWSPCPSCARELVEFINHHHHDHPRCRLRIFTSRLYCHWRRKHQEGLQLLCKSNVPVDVMKLPEFTDCWRNFVDEERPFEEWENLEQYSNSISQRLERILRLLTS